MTVPYTFKNAVGTIPLSQLDDNFAAVVDTTSLASATGATSVGFSPTGTIVATTVQNAISETNTDLIAGLALKTNIADLAATTGAALVGFQQTGTGTVARTVDAKQKETVSVLDFGADPTGVADSTTAIQASFASNRLIIIPPGTYLLKSTRPSLYPAIDPTCILARNLNNLSIEAYGATFIVDPSVAFSSAIMFDKCTNISFKGATIQTDRTGLASNAENVGVTLMSVVGCHISDIHFIGNLGGVGAGFAGDWIVDTTIESCRMDAVGIGFDFAYLQNVKINNITATGADTNGLSGSGQYGEKFLSVINDPPNAAYNYTGLTITNTNNVVVSNCYETNFKTGAALAAGSGYSFYGNTWNKNVPASGGLAIGIYIYYATGTFSSAGFAVNNVTVFGDKFLDNGTTYGSGIGVLIDSAAITTTESISNINVTGCLFSNNNYTGMNITSNTHLANVNIFDNTYSGTLQILPIGNLLSAFTSYKINTLVSFATPVTIKNNTALQWLDSSVSAKPIMSVSASDNTFIRPASGSAYVDIQNFAGTSVFKADTTRSLISSILTMPNNKALEWLDGSASAKTIMSVSASNITFIRPASNSAYVDIQNFAGTSVIRADNTGTNPVSILVNSTFKTVEVGAVDSGGTGYRMLRVTN